MGKTSGPSGCRRRRKERDFILASMCHETPSSIAPRIVALLREENVPWTGNEILSRIAVGEFPCEPHFDETIRRLVREAKLTSDSDPFAPELTSTTRCRLAYVLTDAGRAPTTVQSIPVPVKPKAPTAVQA